MQNTPSPAISLDDIRAVYDHLPQTASVSSVMRHPALLVFVHDPENAANAAGQSFLAQNNDPAKRLHQPLAVAAEMIQGDYKIFDLTPPERQIKPASEADLGLAVSYGMVTVEQGVDFIALATQGQDTDTLLDQIGTLEDIQTHGAMNVAACYGVLIAATMAGAKLVAPAKLAACLERIATSENATVIAIEKTANDLQAYALDLIALRARTAMV
jgi:hypothetical protein